MRLSMIQRFSLLCLPLAALGATVGGITSTALHANQEELTRAQRIHTLSLDARYHVSAMSDAMKSVMLDPQNADEARRKAAADEGYTAALAELRRLQPGAAALRHIEALEHFDEQNLHPNEERILEDVAAGRVEEARALLVGTYMPFLTQFNGLVQGFEEETARGLSQAVAQVDADTTSAMRRILFALAGGVTLVAALLLLLVRRVGGQVGALNGALVESSAGIGHASEELTRAGAHVAEATGRGAACVQSVASAIEQISSMTVANARHAAEGAALAEEASRNARGGQAKLESLRTAMGELTSSARRIAEITTVIDEIAFQTNLLALNAAVEAARAGEHGAGFAVVADAVRSLASRSSEAARDISGLIRDAVERTENGRALADTSGLALAEIVATTAQMQALSQHIAAATSEQSCGVAQIGESIAELDRAGHQNAAVAEEMATSAAELSLQAGALDAVVSRLHVLVAGGEVSEADLTAEAAPEPEPVRRAVAVSPRSADRRAARTRTGTRSQGVGVAVAFRAQ